MLTHESIRRVSRLMEQTGGEYYSFGHEPLSPDHALRRKLGHASVDGPKPNVQPEFVIDPKTGDIELHIASDREK